uniref:Uncharacterized protein n=1 Tax=Romanomermis culicivorax TaxID=13658 RepID=A0A915L2Q5_ROMCU
MSDYERDLIDSKSEALLKSFKSVLQNLAKTATLSKLPDELRRHQQAIIEILTDFMTGIERISKES